MGAALPEDELDRIQQVIAALDPRLRGELRQWLEASAEERAGRIGEFYQRERWRPWTELLIDLEEDELARSAVADALRFGRLRGSHGEAP
jgi:hypothetical protein